MGQQHNELLRAGQLRDAIKDVLEVTEGDVGVERLGETLTPVLDIWSSPEWDFLRNQLDWETETQTVAAVAAQASFFQIFNPPGSNRLVVVQGMWGDNTTARILARALTVTVRGSTGSTFPVARDTRFGVRSGNIISVFDSLTLSIGTSAAFGTDVPLGRKTLNVGEVWNMPPVFLAPGTGFVVSDLTLNEALNLTLFGYSRQARAGELA